MQENLIDFWRRCQLDNPPYWHPDDRPFLEGHGYYKARDFQSFLESYRCGEKPGLQLSLLPVPFSGNLKRATILVLLLNPGFNFADYTEATSEPLKARRRQNLQQDF